MSKHLENSLNDLKKDLLTMGALVESAIQKAVGALHERKANIAREVIDQDNDIDQREVKIEEECLKILALYKPVAEDLRFVATVMKINNDLERMGDLAVNIAKRAVHLSEAPPVVVPRQFKFMCERVIAMVRDGLYAFVNRNPELARKVCQRDDEIDLYHKTLIDDLIVEMTQHPDRIQYVIQVLWSSRNLERIADHVTNIAEDVVYMVEGEIIRHQGFEWPNPRVTPQDG